MIEKTFPKDYNLMTEGHLGREVFFIRSGTLEVTKLVEVGDEKSLEIKELPVCIIDKGGIVGEECMFSPHVYTFSARVSSSSMTVLILNRSEGFLRSYKSVGIFLGMKESYDLKEYFFHFY